MFFLKLKTVAWHGTSGEALSSTSDISLLEIVTKTHGMPKGYCKVLKDGKCLYLGFDDCRHENLKNYLIPKAMLSSWVHGDSHKWIGAGNLGKTDELIRKKKSRRCHSAPPFYQGKKKFLATSESSERLDEITIQDCS
ncbi:hypothetical protein MTR67_009896 [Solanum verrucosum]|uniref:Uncharacterized protein n=1 Tax=Solanum verrucosum TaxID=315347 RepID=A0AAF0Q9N6_SOLVR|nr:hypothetical protein MTR67_009896 [Solanum verrucosum]